MKLSLKLILLVIICTKISAQNINSSLKQKELSSSYSWPLDDNEERRMIKYFVSLPQSNWRFFDRCLGGNFFKDSGFSLKRLNYYKSDPRISPQTNKFITFILSASKDDQSKINYCIKQAEYLRKKDDEHIRDEYIPETIRDNLPKQAREFSVVLQFLDKAVSAKETVLLIRELGRDHINKSRLISILKPLLYRDLSESVEFCVNLTMMSRFYIVSTEASGLLAEINTKESNQLLIDFLKTPEKNTRVEFNKIAAALLLRKNGLGEGALFLEDFVTKNEKNNTIYAFLPIERGKHPDDLKYYFYGECKNNKDMTGLHCDFRITQKLTKQLKEVPYEKRAIATWFKKNNHLLIYDDLLDKWDILDRKKSDK
ncbi:hypothetical protein [Candidatus Uabimicrobium sp. HlEnr_7]|uniref:hypothetical protein n=1 Tax=Candidatus Uabimicrobium helgolandensis TaxID=3095367 RepID=UPI003555FAE0